MSDLKITQAARNLIYNEISGFSSSRQKYIGQEVFWALNDGADRM